MLGPLTRALVGVPAKMLGLLLDIANRLGSADGEGFYSDLAKFVREWRKQVEVAKVYLRHLFIFTLSSTEGGDLKVAEKVFRAYIDPDFERWGILFSGPTPGTRISAEEIILDGKFSDFLGNTAEELERKRITGSQLLAICEKHADRLCGNGRANFFVLTRTDEPVAPDLGNVFVASVRVFDGGLYAYLDEFSYDRVWFSDYVHRVFFPQ